MNQAEINMSSKMEDSLSKLGSYNRVGIPRNLGTNPYMSPYVETVNFMMISRKYSRSAHSNLQKLILGEMVIMMT